MRPASFPKKLCEYLHNPPPNPPIKWSDEGDRIIKLRAVDYDENILGMKWTSFTKNLNRYGFIHNQDGMDSWWCHTHFCKGTSPGCKSNLAVNNQNYHKQ